ncbi:LYR motif-containing protein At3g19508 [Nicotiana tomentosiformis]|uniref:LYR motif-containing protein At3g19508-like n=1 Tax=Nicotiana tabacum TaxID=4097 RepID=A0A1S4BTA9_TOBAC|nr:LYR motif-containing protein At3g19508 [Nicotiana tomentosiformis]XP_016492121.1 PREDICTED: LYR motif-containing protein At3g19508-like [Nicotiana tabacum]XP_033513983.1 LYR motif-containing protein At3g19508 [Nicotiana tomentosiformis]XP_033513984.1 LYR motif-containing protein At3g19508 [Nicotiana tomentosiformis]
MFLHRTYCVISVNICKLRLVIMILQEMKKAIGAYREVLRLVRLLPKDTRPYYAKYVRENFVNYREIDSNDPNALQELLQRTYNHSLWVLNKYSVDQSAADRLKNICSV